MSSGPATVQIAASAQLTDGIGIDFELYKMRRRRHAHLFVTDQGIVQLRAQSWFTVEEARRLVREHAQWILAKLAVAKARIDARVPLADGTVLPLLDEALQLKLRVDAQLYLPLSDVEKAANGREGWVTRRRNQLLVCVTATRADAVRELLGAWYRDVAGPLLGDRLEQLGRIVGHRPNKLRIAAQRSRWGSCSASGTISLNWRLLLLPSELVDYVLVHELCHLVHLNHSSAFWSLVEAHCPDFQCRRERLREAQENLVL